MLPKGGGALGHPKVFSEQLVCILKYLLIVCIVNLDKPGPKACGYVCDSLTADLKLITRFLQILVRVTRLDCGRAHSLFHIAGSDSRGMQYAVLLSIPRCLADVPGRIITSGGPYILVTRQVLAALMQAL